MAAAIYDDKASHSNAFYKRFPSQEKFVALNWGKFVKEARRQLGRMLHHDYPEHMKAEIYDALVADNDLPTKGLPQQILKAH